MHVKETQIPFDRPSVRREDSGSRSIEVDFGSEPWEFPPFMEGPGVRALPGRDNQAAPSAARCKLMGVFRSSSEVEVRGTAHCIGQPQPRLLRRSDVIHPNPRHLMVCAHCIEHVAVSAVIRRSTGLEYRVMHAQRLKFRQQCFYAESATTFGSHLRLVHEFGRHTETGDLAHDTHGLGAHGGCAVVPMALSRAAD